MSDIYNTLMTEFSERMEDIPWNVYPRPQFRRDSFFCLNGKWDFQIDKSDKLPDSYSDKILVPFPPESALSGIERKVGVGEYLYYRRYLTLPEGFNKGRVIIHFGAVDCICKLYVNRNPIGENRGGYIPFSFDITESILDGENEIILKVTDGTNKIYPYGKQKEKRGGMWYTTVSGIWQTVWLESIPEKAICGIRITADRDSALIRVLGGEDKKRLVLNDGGKEYEFSGEQIRITPDKPERWSPESPYLYYFTLYSGEDKVKSYFALRDITSDEVGGCKRILLNGKPYFFSGLLDQGYFPDGIFLPSTPEGYEKDILLAKELGFNMLRKHIKIEPMIFYHLCDKLGIAVFQDMVNNGSYSFFFDTALPTIGVKRLPEFRNTDTETRKIYKEHMLGTAELLYNSPSVVEYTIFNEGWGQFKPDEAYAELKSFDSSRVLDATSGWFHGKLSDFDSRHIYFRMPSIKNPDGRPLFLSEFGGYSLRIEGHLFGKKNYGYKLFETKEEFEAEVEALYKNGVKPLIKSGLSAAVYTQLSDVEDETNGLITYDRQVVKISADKMATLNGELYAELEKILLG